MLENIPSAEQLSQLLGVQLYEIWQKLCDLIEKEYDTERLWNKGGKDWTYEYKYRRGGKTLCALYARENRLWFMVVLGKDERVKFENDRDNFTKEVQSVYDGAQTFYDGKWVMFEPLDASLFDDFIKLLKIKRKPNRK